LTRPFCAEASRDTGEPLVATASRVDRWILVEYRGLWGRDAVAASALPDEVKAHLRERAAARPHTKLLFVRRGDRRRRDGSAVFWARSPERGAAAYRADVERYEDLLELDFDAPGTLLDHPLLLVCTHGKHDRCCARYGRPLYEALREQADDGWVWQSSHVGGDRFAGNVVSLPDGLYFGRVAPADAWPLLDELLARRVHLATYRGRSCYPMRVQAAEIAVRSRTGATGVEDVELVGATGASVRFRVGGRVYEVEVEERQGELTYLTCGSPALRHPRLFAAGIPRESAA